jgi:PAS domain S-box-containing protein
LAAPDENGITADNGKAAPAGPRAEQKARPAIADFEKERLRRELEAARSAESAFRSMFDSLPIGVYRTTPDGKVLLANACMVRMLGFRSFQEMADRNLHGPTYEPDYSRDWFKTEIAREGELKGLEAAWTLPDGSRITVRENARVVRARDGTVLHYEGTVEDIGKAKEYDALLKAKAEFLEEVVSNASIGIFVIDEDNRYVLINPECGRIVGQVPDDWTGKDAGMNVHPEDQGKALAHFIQALSGEQNDFEIRIQASDGTYKSCRINISPMMLGGRAHVLGLVSDVTNLRSAEKELMQKRSYNLSNVLVLAATALARELPAERVEAAMKDLEPRFGKRYESIFEEDMHVLGSYENPDGLAKPGREQVLRRYFRFYSSMLRMMGVRTESATSPCEGSFEIHECRWLEEAKASAVPCRVCQTILCGSYKWAGLNGEAKQVSTLASGGASCRFVFSIDGCPPGCVDG